MRVPSIHAPRLAPATGTGNVCRLAPAARKYISANPSRYNAGAGLEALGHDPQHMSLSVRAESFP
ncbi:MAG: hypothetical protein ACAH88_14375 [Roseimicrobium sp.]